MAGDGEVGMGRCGVVEVVVVVVDGGWWRVVGGGRCW